MEYLGDKLCMEYSELVPEVLDRDNFYYHKRNGNITVHGEGGNGRKILIEFDSLPIKHRAKVREIYGDPYEYASKQPILNSLVWDYDAQRFYTEYLLPNGDKLPASDKDINGKSQINYVHRYTEAATWLNMLGRLTSDKTALKRELNISVMAFWEIATDMIKLKKVNIPSNAKRLKEKIRIYKEGGYESLVEKHKFGNDYSKKVKDEEAESLLKGFLSHRNKFDDTVIADKYNVWAKETGRQSISPGAVGYWRKKWKSYLMLEREGVAKLYTTISKQNQRERPSAPLLLINSDDNVLDAFFRCPAHTVTTVDGKVKEIAKNDWFRPVLYVVMDAHNDYILGYAIGANVTIELVKEAYRNAFWHVYDMTGDAYMWQQIQTDHWGISGKNTTELEHFYNGMATFTPAGLKNSQAKYVERAFGIIWHQKLKECFLTNYSGHNVKAKEQLNPDSLHTRDFPHVEDGLSMVEAFIYELRQSKRKGCELTREQEWIKNFNASAKSKKKLLTPEMRLQMLGKRHEYTNQITTKGVTPTLLGQKLVFELSQEDIFNHIGKDVQVIYDERDLSQVLITDGKGLRMVASQYEKLPSAIADYKEGDKERINAAMAEKKTILPKIQEWGNAWKDTLSRGGIDSESRLKAGVLTKGINHNDQRNYTPKGLNKPVKAGKPTKSIKEDQSIFDEY
ncbi:hypothetical protein [Cyclobacterium marinum]|uniref:Uncharacterized protein n=1 Tax=Cyclobacterium marinum (strain ATCC 25205 / DSM 745 / LMG 13164 / NCIMB 1802) TaxID=880070 RepID=G0J0G1_CYCMS|nr:hypothetical protein [Cyclobacterium marinum]AEL23877.1 hypothetical protein Cycma_0093 [Cyclobacterium marinum DSM 745]